MTHHYRAIVVGGGVAGAGCMYHLAQLGLTDGLLVDQGGLANGSSGRSAAFIETQYLEDDRMRMCAFSLQVYEQLARESGLRFAQIGKLLLGFTSEDLDAFERSVSFQQSIGLDGAAVLGPEAVGKISPPLRTDDITCALWGWFDGYIDAAQLCRIYVADAEARGWTVGVSTQVRAIEVGSDPRFTLATDRGSYSCDILINASGAWAARVGALAGLEIPTAGYRRHVAVYEIAPGLDRPLPIVVVPPGNASATTLYFRHDGPDRILAGIHFEDPNGGLVDEPDVYDRSVDQAFTDELAAKVTARLKTPYELAAEGGWSGLYPLSADGDPILGEATELEGFFNVAALGGNGIQLSAAVGRITADLICKGRTDLIPEVDRYRLERFRAVA
jgi:sarcosine oxidase, subunit beta